MTKMTISSKLKIAAVQMISGTNPEKNLAIAEDLIIEAAKNQARLVVLPEFFIQIAKPTNQERFNIAEELTNGPIQDRLAAIARNLNIYLLAGTILIKSPVAGKFYNTSLLYGPDGKLCCHYKKIHSFKFADKEQSYDEGAYLVPGEQIVSYTIDGFKLGLSICYDLRFPELYRKMGELDGIILPSAFTYITGKAHWEILARARAIENQCYFIAVNQGGIHETGRRTYGHSLIANPWGEVIAACEEGETIIYGELDKGLLNSIRTSLPALTHRKF